MNLPKNILFHTLKSTKLQGNWCAGISQYVDVARVARMHYDKRKFKFFDSDRECSFIFTINYSNGSDNITFIPTFRNKEMELTVVDPKYQHRYEITALYKTEQDILDEIKNIKNKQINLYNFYPQPHASLYEQVHADTK